MRKDLRVKRHIWERMKMELWYPWLWIPKLKLASRLSRDIFIDWKLIIQVRPVRCWHVKTIVTPIFTIIEFIGFIEPFPASLLFWNELLVAHWTSFWWERIYTFNPCWSTKSALVGDILCPCELFLGLPMGACNIICLLSFPYWFSIYYPWFQHYWEGYIHM